MAKCERPLYADQAKGTIGRTITFHMGQSYHTSRFHTYAKDQRSPAQRQQRQRWQTTATSWHGQTSALQLRYKSRAQQPFTGFNDFIRVELKLKTIGSKFGEHKYGELIFTL